MLTVIRGEINSNTIIVKKLNIPHTSMDRASSQKIKETQALNDTLDQLGPIYIQEISSKGSRFQFFYSAHGTFCKIDDILGHKSSLGKFFKN